MMSTPLRTDIFTESPGAGVRADPQSSAVRFSGCGEGFLVGEVVVLGVLVAGDLFSRHGQLHQVGAEFDVLADGFAHLFGTVGEGRDALDQCAAGDGDLLTVRQVARAGDLAGVDGIADHHVQASLRRGGTDAHGVARVEVGLRGPGAQQGVFLDPHRAQPGQVRGVHPGEVGVGVTEAGHQELALTVDDADPVTGLVAGAGTYRGDPVAADQDLTVERVGSRRIEDPHVGEEHGGFGGQCRGHRRHSSRWGRSGLGEEFDRADW